MAGILDFLQTPEAQMGIGLLAAGGPSTTPMNVGQRVQLAMQGLNANEQNKLKLKLLQSQVDENASQNAIRQSQLAQQQRRDAYFMGDGMGGGSPTPAAGLPGSAGLPGGAPMAAPGVAAAGSPVAAGGDKFSQLAAQYGVPRDALVMDYMNNGGKGIAAMIEKRGTPDMQVSGNYAYDKNRIQPGYLPSLNISQDGKASQVQIGPDGQPVVSAPRGAVDTFSAYQGIQDRSRAANTPGRPVILPGGRMGGQSQLSEISGGDPSAGTLGDRNNNPGNLRPPGASTGFQRFDTPEAGLAALDQNLQSYGKKGINTIEGVINRWAPSSENNTSAYVSSVSKRLGIDPKAQIDLANPYVRQALGTAIMLQENGPSILTRGRGAPAQPASSGVDGGGLEFSPSEQAQNEANKVRLTKTAEADVGRDSATLKKEKSAGEMIAAVRRARELLNEGPTGSGAGEMVDKGAAFFGKSTKGAEVSAKLDIVSGDLLNNVPRMEGPQSDGDRIEYKIQAGRAADRTIPPKQRLAAMDELERLQAKYAGLNGGAAPANTQPAGKTFKDFGYASEADAIKDAQRAMLRNPGARNEILRRLAEAGVKMPSGGQGSW
jgi:hypothetical protein